MATTGTFPRRIRLSALLLSLLPLGLVPPSALSQPQLIVVGEVDTARFPDVSARFYAIDDQGAVLHGLRAEHFAVSENDRNAEVLDLTCPPIADPVPVSSVLSIDVSLSMGQSEGGVARLDLARLAASTWIGEMEDTYECAITSFAAGSYLNQDFTANRDLLYRALDYLRGDGSTNFLEGLIGLPSGGITVAARGQHRRIVIFVTDGIAPVDTAQVLAQARQANVEVYAVVLGGAAWPDLRTVANATGGYCFDGVRTAEQIRAIYRLIHRRMQGLEPCTITWRGDPSCTRNRAVRITSAVYGLGGSTSYTAAGWHAGQLVVDPDSLDFGPVQPGKTKDRKVTLRAEGGPIDIVEFRSGNSMLSVVEEQENPGFLPVHLDPGDTLAITVRAAPIHSSAVHGDIRIRTNLCYESRIVTTSPASGSRNSIWVVHPDGGEKFEIGRDTTITWSGVQPTDPVRVEYSADSGKTWSLVAARATGLSYPWKVPSTPSSRCLARVTHLNPDSTISTLSHQFGVLDVGLLPEERVVTLDVTGALHLWEQGLLSYTIPGSHDYALAVSPDGRFAALAGKAGHDVTVRDLSSGGVTCSIPDGYLTGGNGSRDVKSPLCFTPDGTAILTAKVAYETDVTTKTVRLYDAQTGAVRQELTDPDFPCRIAAYSPEGSYCAFGGTRGNIRIRTGDLARILYTLRDPNGEVAFLSFSPDGRELVSVAEQGGRWFYSLWDIVQGTRIGSVLLPRPVGSVGYNPATRSLLVADGEAVLYDLSTRTVDREYLGHTDAVHSARFSSDGSLVATASADRTVRIRQIDPTYSRSDVSDTLWSILAPEKVGGKDVEFGKVRVRTGRDSTVAAYVRNEGIAAVEVTGMNITGPHGADFLLLSGRPPFTLAPGKSHTVELAFFPGATGDREAVMEIVTAGGMLQQRLHGIGVEPQLKIVGLQGNFIDFGPVPVGDERDSLAWCVNVGAAPLMVASLTHRGPDDRQFAILGSDPGTPAVLLPGDSMQVFVRFAPVQTGYAQGGVAVAYDGDGSPEVIGLFGQGIGRSDPAVAAPESLEFPAQLCRAVPDTGMLEISNPGSAPLEITDAILDGPHAGDFSLAPSFLPFAIPMGEARQIRVVFSPGGPGLRTARLLLKSNAVNAPEHSVELLGSFSTTELAGERKTLDLGRLCPEESGEIEVTLRNGGPAGTAVRAIVLGQAGGVITLPDPLIFIAGEDSARFKVRFAAAKDNGDFSAQIGFTDTLCGAAVTVRLVGTVAAPVIMVDSVGEICPGEEIPLAATGAEQYRWSPADGLSCTDCPTPVAAPGRTTTYTVTGYDADGCFGVDSVTVRVRENPDIVRAAIGRGYRAFPGDTVSVAVELAGSLPSLAGVERLRIDFAYDPSVMTIDTAALPRSLQGTLLEGWSVEIPEANGGVLRARFTRSSGAPLRGPGTLFRLECRPFLSRTPGTELAFDITAPDNSCMEFETSSGYVGIDSLCGLPYRLFEVALTKYGLGEIAPNPANGTDPISIPFSLAFDGHARLEIFDSRGEQTALLVNSYLEAGSYGVDWDAGRIGSGLYYYRITSGDFTETKRVVLVR